jgi:pimeloyl-ACP methyl ester carboxylesterase
MSCFAAAPMGSPSMWLKYCECSWDDMALYDLPATVEHVLSVTQQPTLAYVGHSEGTTQAFAGFSRNQTLASRVSLFVALAPVAFVHSQTSPVFTLLADLGVAELFQTFGLREFLANGSMINKIAPEICHLLPTGCDIAIFLFCGPTRHENATRLPVYISKTPGTYDYVCSRHVCVRGRS